MTQSAKKRPLGTFLAITTAICLIHKNIKQKKAPTFATFGNFIRNELTSSIEDIFNDINAYIFNQEKVDLNHTYIDGTKIEANANKYTWVWKKSCMTNRDKVFGLISVLIEEMNSEVLCTFGVKIELRDEYAIEYLEEILEKYAELTALDFDSFVYGKGHRKTIYQRQYEKLNEYKERLKNSQQVKKNKYGRTKEIYECEDCTGCPHRGACCKKKEGNRTALAMANAVLLFKDFFYSPFLCIMFDFSKMLELQANH